MTNPEPSFNFHIPATHNFYLVVCIHLIYHRISLVSSLVKAKLKFNPFICHFPYIPMTNLTRKYIFKESKRHKISIKCEYTDTHTHVVSVFSFYNLIHLYSIRRQGKKFIVNLYHKDQNTHNIIIIKQKI